MKPKLKAIKILLPALLVLLTMQLSFPGIDDSWDWIGTNRTLKVWYDFDADKAMLGNQKLKDIMDEAINEWNKVAEDTGWNFCTNGTKDEYDIKIEA